ncbi:MAG TPA: metallophosphoesterase [Burkholderiales bacterium]|nr:metallophosphoesterase [Burkholderiales bacterium]
MKIRPLSDLHLEHSGRHPPFELPPVTADVVVLAGDIDNGTRAVDWAEHTFPGNTVLYVPGNHEFYGTNLPEAAAALQERTLRSGNVHLLDNKELLVDGVRFLGSTLWTDFALLGVERQEQIFEEARKYVLDFRKIRMGKDFLTPQQTVCLHQHALLFLEARLQQPFPGKTVVITHHAPHPGSVHPRWTGNLCNPAFVSDLRRLMGKSALWIHGHTHDSFDYCVNGTRVLANPMGYRSSNWRDPQTANKPMMVYTENARFDAGLVIEI